MRSASPTSCDPPHASASASASNGAAGADTGADTDTCAGASADTGADAAAWAAVGASCGKVTFTTGGRGAGQAGGSGSSESRPANVEVVALPRPEAPAGPARDEGTDEGGVETSDDEGFVRIPEGGVDGSNCPNGPNDATGAAADAAIKADTEGGGSGAGGGSSGSVASGWAVAIGLLRVSEARAVAIRVPIGAGGVAGSGCGHESLSTVGGCAAAAGALTDGGTDPAPLRLALVVTRLSWSARSTRKWTSSTGGNLRRRRITWVASAARSSWRTYLPTSRARCEGWRRDLARALEVAIAMLDVGCGTLGVWRARSSSNINGRGGRIRWVVGTRPDGRHACHT